MKKVLLVNPFDKIPGESFRDQRFTFIYELLKNKADVVWVSSDFHHWTHRRRNLETIPTEDRQRIVLIPMREYRHNLSLSRQWSYLLYSIGAMRRIGKISPPPDLILCMAPVELMFLLALYARMKKITYIVDILDIWPDLFARAFPQGWRWLARLLLLPYYFMSFIACRLATHITSVSKTYTSWAMRRGRRGDLANSSYYYLGCVGGNKAYNYSKPRDRLRCLFAGQFGFNYDVGTIIEAAKIMEDSCQKMEFIFAGDGYKLPETRRAAQGMKNVEFLGWISSGELEQLARDCHIGLCCYVKGATQSVPTKFFDYMSLGLCLVNSLPGEAAALIEEEGIGINYPAGDAKELARGIVPGGFPR